MRRRYLFYSIILICTLTSCFSECSSNSGNGGGGNNGHNGHSPDEPERIISNDATYEFESVNLTYDLSNKHNTWTYLYLDTGDLYRAHGTDPTELKGSINNLYNILEYSDDYSESYKPKIEITIQPVGKEAVVHSCTKDDVGANYVCNLPNYGAQINSLIVKVESITTTANQIRLCWSKSFDLHQSWWQSVEDKALSGDAEIVVGGYAKCIASNDILITREVNGEYILVSYTDADFLEGNVIDCDVQITTSPAVTSPTLEGAIYIDGSYDEGIEWEEPTALQIVEP